MRNRQSGFTLLEMLIAMAILGIIMAMNSTLLQEMIRGTRQQGAVVSSQFEVALGLEVFRNDLANAGFGLPDSFSTAINYTEPAGDPAQQFNDSVAGVPRALVHKNDVSVYGDATYLANSDYLVIKSPAVGMNDAAGKWTYITNAADDYVHVWNDPSLDMKDGYRMIVIKARTTTADTAQLIINEKDDPGNPKIYATYVEDEDDPPDGTILNSGEDAVGGFRPPDPPTGDRYIVYGVDTDTNLKRPFNRADYYVRRVAAGANATGAGCAPGTGTLYKAVVNQADDGFQRYPIMDCVANMQIEFRLDTDNNGVIDSTVNDISALTAIQIKERVKEIRVYILAHEGMFDRGFTYSGSSTITVGPSNVNVAALVTDGNWGHYRWKVYTLFVKPRSFY